MSLKRSLATGAMIIVLAACESALDPELTTQRVRLQAPANNLLTTDSVHTFYWETLEGATRYQLQVVSPRFDSVARLGVDTIINRNQFSQTLRRGSYQWRVRAFNGGSTSAFSDTFSLTIQ
ncbi:MAG TPA: hypothetical protein VGB46_05295 [Flavisolibacter sp.]|jgi:hypothetical protein